ncbi:UNVERIFIED_CONTAM: hypothetical protein K2H54_012268 [Gekko kuhli]
MAEKMVQQQDKGGGEEAPWDSQKRAAGGDADEASASGSPEDFWPPRGEKHPVPLEVIVKVVDSLYSLQGVEQLADSPQSAGQGSPEEGGPLAHESCYITEDEDLLRDSPESTGYYPCFRTCSHLPPDQPEEREVPSEHPGKAYACIQVGGAQHNKASQWEGGPEAKPSGEEARTKPRPEKRSPVPSLEQTSEGDIQGQMATKSRQEATLSMSCPPGLTTSRRAVNCVVKWVRQIFRRSPHLRPEASPAPNREKKHGHIGTRLQGCIRKHCGRVHPHPSEEQAGDA